MKWLVFDISNLLHRTFFAQKNEDEDVIAGMATHSALTTLNKYFKMFKPDRVVMALDRSSWRKEYTASEQCLSKKPYKGNRRQDMTQAQQEKYARFLNHLKEFEALIANHTTIITLACNRLEADDLIGGFCQLSVPTDEVIVVTTDTDMSQLLKYSHVRVVSPATDEDHTLEKFDNDPLFYLFAKCIRGDATDNVQSAYPRVRLERIRKAFDDPYEYVKLMNEEWTNQTGTTFRVEDMFKENQTLIDLEKQPDDIRTLIEDTIFDALEKKREFSMFYLLQFVGKYKLERIKDTIDQYLPLLSRTAAKR